MESSLNDFSKHIEQPSITVSTYINMYDCNHALGSPVKSFPNLRHLDKSLRRRSTSIIQPEEIEAKLILQITNKRKKLQLIEQQIQKINVARYSKNEQKLRCQFNGRKSPAQFQSCNDLRQPGKLSRASIKYIEDQTQTKQKKDLMNEKIKKDQQSYKKIQNKFQLKLKKLAKIKGQIQKNRLQLDTMKIENSKRLQAEQVLQKNIFALQEQINIKQKQKEQILTVFDCLKISFDVQQQIKQQMNQKYKIKKLQTLQQRLKQRDHQLIDFKKLLNNCRINSGKHLQGMKSQAQYSRIQQYLKKLLEKKSSIKQFIGN